MTLVVTRSDEETIAIPLWLIYALGLHEGERVEASAIPSVLRITPERASTTLIETNGKHHAEDDDGLERLIAEIKATPPNPNAVHPATKSGEQFRADLEANPPSPELFTFAEWQPLWAAFEAEEKALARAHEIAEGRG